MKTHNYRQLILLLCATLLFSSVGKTSRALIPVIDSGTIAQAIENNINMALELKSVKKVVELAGKMNTVIGEALSTFNEYVTTYYQYKEKVDNALGKAADFAAGADKVLGTNISDAVVGVADVYGQVSDLGDKVVSTGAVVADFATDVKNGAGAVSGAVGAAQDAANKAGEYADKEACKKCKKEGGNCLIVCGETAGQQQELASAQAEASALEDELDELYAQLEAQKASNQDTSSLEKEIQDKERELESLENRIAELQGQSGSSSSSSSFSGGNSGTSSSDPSTSSPTGGNGLTAALTGSGTNNGFAIIPNELADYCGITAADITNLEDKPKVVECLKKLITQRNAENKDDQREAHDIYVRAFHETAYANVAEAVVMRNYAVNYEKQVLEPMTEQLKQAKTVRDDYSGVILVNKEIANLINKLLMVYSSKVAYDAFKDYGDFEIYPEDILNIGDSGK